MDERDATKGRTLRPGSIVGGRFLIERTAGTGGMGAVFRAVDQLDGTQVALKLVQDDDAPTAERFAREVGILAELIHPGIVRYIAHGTAPGGTPFVAMEWLEGEDLASVLAARRMHPLEGLVLVQKAAEALGFAHARGVVHRDVKPGNLFLCCGEVERIKVIDFGVAAGAAANRKLTYTGAIVGTPAYMAPEQIQALSAPAPSADVFSLGCVLYECLTGHPAFEGPNLMARLAKILLSEPPRLRAVLPEAPAALDRLLSRMLARDAMKRPPDGDAVAAELAAIVAYASAWLTQGDIAGGPVSTGPPSDVAGGRSLTRDEQRLVTVVLAGDPGGGAGRAASEDVKELAAAIAPYGGRLDVLSEGSLVVTAWGPGSALDRAERAAHCALAIRARFPTFPVAITTGRGRVSAQVVEGDVLDQAVSALRAASPGAIRLDAASADMLRAHFHVDLAALTLGGERPDDEGVAHLLGRPSPFVGRARELATLEGIIAACAEDSVATAVLLTGPAGSGKTRLSHELCVRIDQREPEITILSGRGDSTTAGSPFAIAADMIRRAAGIQPGEPLALRREKLSARIGRHVKGSMRGRVVAFLGAMSGTPLGDADEAVRAASESPRLMGDSMRAAWEEWIAAECSAHPVLLVLENLHAGDEASVRLIDGVLRNLADRPLTVLGIARPDVHGRFPGLWAERGVQAIKLGALPRKASERMVTQALEKSASAGVVARIVERAAGNPFFLEELIRAVAAGRGDTFPDSVLAMVEARLDAEGIEAKRVLRAASVFGERFTVDGVKALLGGAHVAEAAEAADRIEILAAREIVTPIGASLRGEHVFPSALVREAAYAMLTDEDRALGHRLAGEWLEQSDHPDHMAVAEHFRRGGEPARAVAGYRRAAEHALSANALGAVLERVERGVASGASGEDLGALRLCEAEARLWRGELSLAEERGREAIALLPEGSVLWLRSITQVGIAAGKRGDIDRVEELIGQASAAVPEAGAAGAKIVCVCSLTTYLIFSGRYAAADARMAETQGLASLLSPLEPQVAVWLHELRAIRATVAGDLGAGLDGFRAALSAHEQMGDQRNASAVRSNLGFVLAELGDFAGAEQALRSAATVGDRMGLHDMVTNALCNLGRVLAYRGALAEARRVEQQALSAYTELGDPRLSGSARAYLAQIELIAGDFEAAEREARVAADALAVAPPLRAFALAVLARALLAQGRADEAYAPAREAHEQLEAEGSIEEGESTVRLAYAEALQGRGAQGERGAVLAAARARLLDRAAKISDPTWRERFLAGVPDNARVLSLSASILSTPA